MTDVAIGVGSLWAITSSTAPPWLADRVRICLIASARFPIAEPFAGGLEALTHVLAHGLARRGHEVTLFAGPGSDVRLPVRLLLPAECVISEAAMRDRNAPSDIWVSEHHAYLDLMLRLVSGVDQFDVVHNNSLHHLPVAMAGSVPVPVVTTLHTPPLPWLESALALASGTEVFTAVSAFTAASWRHVVRSTVIHNGVDLDHWQPGRGGGPAVWFGRLVAEKAPHEAIDACRRAGVPLLLVGPEHDVDYVAREITPRLGDGVDYLGHLSHTDLRAVLGRASVVVVTPQWDEPYGLVAAEAMACGTPVAAYDRGALAEVIGGAGMLAEPGDVDGLAAAVLAARRIDRRDVRRHAELTCSVDQMIDQYENLYVSLNDQGNAA